ncbi:MAG: TonB-dependent receptor [Ferruginibacter sp.]
MRRCLLVWRNFAPVMNEFVNKKLLFTLLTLLSFQLLSAQDNVVRGKVTSGDNPLQNVTVQVKGGRTATQTNEAGEYSITAAPNATLVFTSVGFTTQELNVNNKTSLNISLLGTTQQLEQVVVVGYGTQKRKDLTGAISSVSAATIEKVPVINATQALQGRAAGVQIMNNDASPGGNISILIRGIGSLASGGNDPLYVIDGYPTSGGVNNINPNDIASIDVLKDASATAVYGIRAANGVVIITTKKGLKNRVQISVDAYNAFQSTPKKYDLLNAQNFATMSNQIEASDSTHTYTGLPIWKTPGALHSVDWQDALYRGGLTQNYSVGIRGGSDKVQSAISFGYYDQKGIVLGSFFKRFTVGLNMDYQPTTWLKSATSVKYGYQDANTPFGTSGTGGGGGLFQLVVNPPTLDSGNRFTTEIKDANGNYGFYNPINPNVFKFNNPVYNIETNKSKNITNYLLANSSLEATIFEGLRIKTSAGVNVNNFSGSFYQPEDNRAFLQSPTAVPTKPFYHQNLNNNFEWLWENTIAYDKTFGIHAINFVGGISAQKNVTTMNGAGGNPPNAVIRDLAQLSNLQFDRFGNGQFTSTLASQFARLTYQLNDKYILTGTVRRDGSSRFDSSHQYGVFPSGAIAWKVKNESFLRNANWLSDLKIRGGYGVVGNQASIGLFQYQALYAGNFAANVNGGGADNLGYPFNEIYQNGIAQTQPANPNLKWETDYTTNLGIDAAFMGGALTVTVDWFNRDSKDFLLRIPSSPQTGYNFITRNVGEMNNKGFEVAINYNGKRSKDFSYSVGVTWSAIKNKLINITSGLNTLLSSNFGFQNALAGQGWADFSQSAIGGKVGDFFGYQSLGIFQTQAEITALNSKAPGGIYYRAATRPGDRYFADINGDGVVNANDRISLGSPQPKFFGGLNFDANYKTWDFNLFFYGSYGNKILNYIENNLQSFQKRGSEGVQNVSNEYFNSYWTPTRPSNTFARALATDENTLNSVPSSAWVENGSYLKLKNLTIGYTLPANIASKLTMSRLRAYFSTQNLFTITSYSGLDPEIGIQGGNAIFNGVDNGIYPSSRFFTVGLNVTF